MTKDEIKLRGSPVTASSPTSPQSCCLLCIHVKGIFNHLLLLQNVCLSLSGGYGCCRFSQFFSISGIFQLIFLPMFIRSEWEALLLPKVKGQGQWSAIGARPVLTRLVSLRDNWIFKVKAGGGGGYFCPTIVKKAALLSYLVRSFWVNSLIRLFLKLQMKLHRHSANLYMLDEVCSSAIRATNAQMQLTLLSFLTLGFAFF